MVQPVGIMIEDEVIGLGKWMQIRETGNTRGRTLEGKC